MAVEINRELNSRIKQVRLKQGLSQRAFAAEIGISGPGVARIESCENNASEQTLRAICDRFSIRREWLDSGEGDMFRQLGDYEAVIAAMEGANENKKQLIRIIAEMPDELLNAAVSVIDYVEERRRKR